MKKSTLKNVPQEKKSVSKLKKKGHDYLKELRELINERRSVSGVRNEVKKFVKKVFPEAEKNKDVLIQLVEKKAYELYEQRGGQHGCHLDDWLEAEKLVKNQLNIK